LEYWLEGARGRNRLDAVHHKNHERGSDGAGVVHIAEVDARHGAGVVHIAEIGARHGEIAVARGGDGGDKDAWVFANPHEAIGQRWEFLQKPLAAHVVYVPAVSGAYTLRTPVLSAASVYRDHPIALTAVIHILEHNGFGESVGEKDSIEVGDELLAPHMLGNTDDMGLDIAEGLAYPKHWSNAG